jgi:hypothetical protein
MASEEAKRIEPPFFRCGNKPYIRWWWLAGPFREQDIQRQLDSTPRFESHWRSERNAIARRLTAASGRPP